MYYQCNVSRTIETDGTCPIDATRSFGQASCTFRARIQGVRRGARRPGQGTAKDVNRHVYCVIFFEATVLTRREPVAQT